jgi:hypothetical protein
MSSTRFRHAAGRPLGSIVTHPEAECYNCGTPAREDFPLMYVRRAGSTPNGLICESCREVYARPCYDLDGQYSVDYVVLHNGPPTTYYTRDYAAATFYWADEEEQWFLTPAHYTAYSRANNADGPPTFNYHETDPLRQFGWPTATQAHELCFGVELEMENRRADSLSGQRALSQALGGRTGGIDGVDGAYILARDGSLNQSGVELITSPYTLDYHRTKFGWDRLLEGVAKIGMSGKGTDRCGMHVHMNRAAISALTLGKMLVFVNHGDNSALINRIAQRQTHFAQRVAKKVIQGKEMQSSRYESLHIAEKTIECRLFRGNLRPERVYKNIEFCHALVSYCSQASIKNCQGFADFIQWLGANRGVYKHLVKFLAPHYDYKLTREDKTEDM